MTVGTSAYVYCDGRMPSPSVPDRTIGCGARVEGGERPDGSWVFPRTKAEARKEARARGWTFVRHPRLRVLDKDLCPDHNPDGES